MIPWCPNILYWIDPTSFPRINAMGKFPSVSKVGRWCWCSFIKLGRDFFPFRKKNRGRASRMVALYVSIIGQNIYIYIYIYIYIVLLQDLKQRTVAALKAWNVLLKQRWLWSSMQMNSSGVCSCLLVRSRIWGSNLPFCIVFWDLLMHLGLTLIKGVDGPPEACD